MDTGRIRVLLIEDNPADARLIQEALIGIPGAAFHFQHADRLSTGLERLDHGDSDVVLLDLSLPDSQGLDTLLRAHTKAPHMPIVVLTGLVDESFGIEAVQRGAQDYLNKSSIQMDARLLGRSIRYAIERKRAEEEVVRLASFPEQHPNPIIETDEAGVVTYLNPAARLRFPELADPASRHPLLDGMRAAMMTLRESEKSSLVHEISFGETVYEQHVSYIPASQVLRSYNIDITERKGVERLKDDFLSTVSHELRTPLATMKEFIAIIMDHIAGPVTADQQQYLGIIKANIDRLTRIINDLLDMAKIEAGHTLLNKASLEARTLLEHVVRSMKPLVDQKRLTLELDVPDALPRILADADKITQVLMNLISNAIKFTSAPGKITVSISDGANEMEFRVADTGIGIAESDLKRLFEKFTQVQSLPIGGGRQGTGLGLAISKRLVELHGGRIWATSAPGKGSVFAFTLPKHGAEEVFQEYCQSGIEQAKRKQSCFSIILVSLQHFPALKRLHGLEEANRLVKELETLARDAVRLSAGDIVTRWQRGEMVVVLSEVDKAHAQLIADRLRQTVQQRTFTVNSQPLKISLLTTTATYPDEATTAEELLQITEGRLPSAESSKKHIMVVDDELKIRNLVKEVLESRDYEVTTAASGPEALTQLKSRPVDLILLDLAMPVMDGYELYHLLKETPQTKDIPVLIVTGRGERRDRQLGLESASYNYLTKPFQIEELLAKVREILQHASQHP